MKNLSEVNVTTELLEKVQECGTADELMELARENGAELTLEEAEECIREMTRDLTDEEMEKIAGGDSPWQSSCTKHTCSGFIPHW